MRAASTPRTVAGIPSVSVPLNCHVRSPACSAPVSRRLLVSSSTKKGLPSVRATTRSRTSSESFALANSDASSALVSAAVSSGSANTCAPGTLTAPSGRLVRTASTGRSAGEHSCSSMSMDAASAQCRSSTIRTKGARAARRASTVRTATSNRSGYVSRSARDDSSTIPYNCSNGANRTGSSTSSRTPLRSLSRTMSSESWSSMASSVDSRSITSAYGVFCASAEARPARHRNSPLSRFRNSSIRRLLPTPGSARTSTVDPFPALRRSAAASNESTSARRPTNSPRRAWRGDGAAARPSTRATDTGALRPFSRPHRGLRVRTCRERAGRSRDRSGSRRRPPSSVSVPRCSRRRPSDPSSHRRCHAHPSPQRRC